MRTDAESILMLIEAIDNDNVQRKPGLTRKERRASVINQLQRCNNPFTHQVLALLGEASLTVGRRMPRNDPLASYEGTSIMQCHECQSEHIEELLDRDGDCVLYWLYM